MLAVGAAGIVLGIVWLIVPEWRVHHDFVETTCTVVERRVDAVQAANGTSIGRKSRIKYKCRGADLLALSLSTFTTSTPGIPLLSSRDEFASRDEAQAAIDRFADGETCPCWYDPADPGIAVVVRGYQWWIWPALLVPASFVAIGAGGLVYTALYWGKSAERRAAAAEKVPRGRVVRSASARRSEIPLHPRWQRDHQQPRHAAGLSAAASAIARLDALRAACGVDCLERGCFCLCRSWPRGACCSARPTG